MVSGLDELVKLCLFISAKKHFSGKYQILGNFYFDSHAMFHGVGPRDT